MAISRRPTDLVNNSAEFTSGSYQFTNIDDMINNFMVAYVGSGKVLNAVPRHEVAFWMQRAVQEFNYDIFPAEKNLELELGPTRTIKLPNDYVKVVKVAWIDAQGLERVVTRNRQASTSQAIVQDNEYDPVLDFMGDKVVADTSEQQKLFQDPQTRSELLALAQNYYYNYITDYNYSYYNESYYGRQWGANPEEVFVNGTYLIDDFAGTVVFDYLFREGQLVTFRYISDGLGENGDFTKVFVPKLAEDAVYSSVLYNLSKIRPSAAGAAPLYKKEAYAKMKNAKIRLMNLNREEMAQIFRGKSKWIKH